MTENNSEAKESSVEIKNNHKTELVVKNEQNSSIVRSN